jgi:hypothetical protein
MNLVEVNRRKRMAKRSKKETERLSVGVRVLVAIVALFIIASGAWLAATGVSAFEGPVFDEGPVARIVGVAVVVIGVIAFLRTICQPWGKGG